MRFDESDHKWSLYGVMCITGIGTIVSGVATLGHDRWNTPYICLYTLWVIATMAFVCLNIEKTKSFVIRVMRYLVSTALVLWLSSVVFRTDSNTLPPYIPASVDIGIVLTYCLDHIWHELRKGARRVWTRFRDWNIDWMIRMLQPAPHYHEVPLLPLHNSTATTAGIVIETERSVH